MTECVLINEKKFIQKHAKPKAPKNECNEAEKITKKKLSLEREKNLSLGIFLTIQSKKKLRFFFRFLYSLPKDFPKTSKSTAIWNFSRIRYRHLSHNLF